MRVPSLVLIAQVVLFQSTDTQSHRYTVTDATDDRTHASATTSVGNKAFSTKLILFIDIFGITIRPELKLINRNLPYFFSRGPRTIP